VLKKAKRWHLFADEIKPLPLRQKVGKALGYEEKLKLLKTAASRPEWQNAAWATPWFRYFLSYDPKPALMKVRVPVLAVNGDKDLQVPAKEDLEGIDEALKAGGNKDYKIVLLPNLNHLFQNSKTGAPSEYAQIDETLAPIALQAIGDWIAVHTIAAPHAN